MILIIGSICHGHGSRQIFDESDFRIRPAHRIELDQVDIQGDSAYNDAYHILATNVGEKNSFVETLAVTVFSLSDKIPEAESRFTSFTDLQPLLLLPLRWHQRMVLVSARLLERIMMVLSR